MAEDERAPDFKDLLAAFDIPDVSSATSQAKMQRTNSEKSNCIQHNNDVNKSKAEDTDKTSAAQVLPSPGNPIDQVSSMRGNYEREVRDADSKYSAVNGSGAEASSSFKFFKNLKEEMDMYQLSSNVLPSYMPAIPPQARFNMNAPSDGFKCLDCNDTFLFEASLIQHLQRRSVYITFDCDTCKKLLIYYNRCSLLSHIRSHHEKSEAADIKKATVNPLPPDLMNGFHGFVPPFPMLPAALMQHLQLQQPLPLMIPSPQSMQQISSLQNHMSKSSPTARKPKTPLPSEANAIQDKNRYSCTECCQSYSNAISLEEHFGCSQNLPLGTSQCSKCKMTCASKCSLSAHERIHLDVNPYVCPECGVTVSDRESFIYHVTMKCLHYSRVIGYKCSTCLILSSDPIVMRKHTISEHTEAYYKCQACPMAFKAGHSFESHKKTAHLTMDVDCKTIYKCPLCDIVFQGETKLDEHLDMHIKEQIQNIKFVFKCMTCSELFNKKSILKDHIIDKHPEALNNKESCNSCEASFDSVAELEKHQEEAHPINLSDDVNTADDDNQNGNVAEEHQLPSNVSWNNGTQPSTPCVCSNCSDIFHSVNGYLAHKKTCGSQILQCNVCQFVAKDKEELIEDGRKHLAEGVMVCLLCFSDKRFENKKSLFKHIEVHVANKADMNCELCSDEFSDSKELLKHLRSEHGFNPVKCDMCDAEFYGSARMQRHKMAMHSNSITMLTCPLCNQDSFTTQGFLDKHLIISHNLSLEEIGDLRNRQPIQSQSIKTQTVSPKIKSELLSSDGDSASRSPPNMLTDCDNDDECQPPPSKKVDLESNHKIDVVSDEDQAFICSKCQFSSNDRSVFWKHIVIHKVDQSAYQCLECGSCFVVIPSLRKHMFLVHKIRDFDAYVAEAGHHLINGEDLGSKNGTSLNCDVCCQSFSDETTLKNHMRNHGMAFVRSHSTSLASVDNETERSN